MLKAFAPLGIFLPSGLTLKIDDTDLGRVPFVRCVVVGCLAYATLDDAILEKFSAGKTAIFLIYRTEEQGYGVPVSLSGFSEGLAALKTHDAAVKGEK